MEHVQSSSTLLTASGLIHGRLASGQRHALDAVGAGRGTLLIVGGPGTGKTTTLLNSVISRVRAGEALESLLIIAGSRFAAQRVRAQIVAGLGRSQLRPNVMTIHGLAQTVLRQLAEPGQPLPGLLTAPDQEAALRDLLAAWPASRWPDELRMAVPTRGFATQLRALLARTRQLGLDPAELSQIGVVHDRPELVTAGEFFAEYLDVLDARGVLDYAELIHRARLAMTNSSAWQFAADLQTVYVDEFAELDRAQLQLVADVVRVGPGLVAFADPTTSVFGFRGADQHAVAQFGTRFAGLRPAVEPRTIELTEQLRGMGRSSYLELVAANDAVSRRLGARLERIAGQPADAVSDAGEPDESEASVRTIIAPNDQLAAEQIAIRLRRAHADGMPWDQMAVISRAGQASLGQLARRLQTFGIPVQVWGDEVALRAEAGVRPLLDALNAAGKIAAGEQIPVPLAERLLRSPLAGASALDIRALGRRLRKLAFDQLASDHDADRPTGGAEWRVPSAAELIAAELSREVLLPDQPRRQSSDAPPIESGEIQSDLETQPGSDTEPSQSDSELALAEDVQTVIGLRALLTDVAERLAAGADSADLLWRIWSGTDWPQGLQSEALSGSEAANRANRDLDAVIALFDLADRAGEFVGQKGLAVLLEQVEAQQIAADTARESDPRGRGVAVLTAHRAKGLQWPLVVVTGLQEGIWPRVSVAPQLLGADQLSGPDQSTGAGLEDPVRAAELIAADRRAFLLAISRSCGELLAVASSGDEGEGNRPSRFCFELGGPVLDAKYTELPRALPSLDGLVAQLRHHAGDVNQPPALRRAAATRLAELAAATDSQGRRLVPSADPRRWWGLDDYSDPAQPVATPGQPIRLTGSELESLLACPRSWFLSRRAKAEQAANSAAGLGTIIHTLAQHALSEGLDIDQLRTAVDDIWAEVPFEAAWLSVSERGELDAALERLQAWSQAAADREVVGVEVPFNVVVDVGDEVVGRDQVQLLGAVDRLEVTGDLGVGESDQSGNGEPRRLRIIDFKTGRSEPTAAQAAQSDQLGVYQLAAQAGAFNELIGEQLPLADAQLVYLRSKAKDAVSPKVFVQPSLDERPWLETGVDQPGTWVHERLTQAARIVRSEEFDAKANPRCQFCAFKAGCPAIGMGR